METEKSLMDFSAANALDTEACTKSVLRVAARAVCLLNSLKKPVAAGAVQIPSRVAFERQ